MSPTATLPLRHGVPPTGSVTPALESGPGGDPEDPRRGSSGLSGVLFTVTALPVLVPALLLWGAALLVAQIAQRPRQ